MEKRVLKAKAICEFIRKLGIPGVLSQTSSWSPEIVAPEHHSLAVTKPRQFPLNLVVMMVQQPRTSRFPQTEVLTFLQNISDGYTQPSVSVWLLSWTDFNSVGLTRYTELSECSAVCSWLWVSYCQVCFFPSSSTCPSHLPPLILNFCCQRSRPLHWIWVWFLQYFRSSSICW
jgi:hypothetical protein